ncbi:mannose-6-phosphate isomerase [Theileria orientalis]|uniref:mannose-6-phosphate isomerase n=1 Tax=Theileria orientalis TaxID=68886 RepID=A0A976QS18_THEOR|nr:mannose-6-phosphate isomerase [Theileria orientalis]
MDLIYRLLPTVNQYDWGKRGEESLVYKLSERNFNLILSSGTSINSDGPFSEFWFGAHQSSPSSVLPYDITEITLISEDGSNKNVEYSASFDRSREPMSLSKLISRLYYNILGIKDKELKILFKVLSIQKPLSLQMHPDNESAVQLFNDKHDGIVDSSSKPEMCLPLTKFRALCGFRDESVILDLAQKYSEFGEAIDFANLPSDGSSLFYVSLLKKLFFRSDLSDLVSSLAQRLRDLSSNELVEAIFLNLYDNYGPFPSVLFPFVLNCFELNPGEALFVPPNTLHSYISGDCIEIMKSSDNVIRCGLTPKFKDLDLCLALVDKKFKRVEPEEYRVNPCRLTDFTLKYSPEDPCCNFLLLSITVGPGQKDKLTLPHNAYLCIVLESNPKVSLKLAMASPSDEDSAKNDSHTIYHVLSVVSGDCLLIVPNTELRIHNDHDTLQLTMYLSSEK